MLPLHRHSYNTDSPLHLIPCKGSAKVLMASLPTRAAWCTEPSGAALHLYLDLRTYATCTTVLMGYLGQRYAHDRW